MKHMKKDDPNRSAGEDYSVELSAIQHRTDRCRQFN